MAKSGFRWQKHDLTGQRFGKLVAEGYDPRVFRGKNPAGQEVWFGKWLCRCDCGNHVYKETSELRGGFGKSCGCSRQAPDMTGQRFGMIEVIRRDYTKPQRTNAMWLVRCDCGQERVVSASVLRRGQQKSCGCQKVNAMRNAPKRLESRQKGIIKKRHAQYMTKAYELARYGISVKLNVNEFTKVKNLALTPLPWKCHKGHEFMRPWYSAVKMKTCPQCRTSARIVNADITILPMGAA